MDGQAGRPRVKPKPFTYEWLKVEHERAQAYLKACTLHLMISVDKGIAASVEYWAKAEEVARVRRDSLARARVAWKDDG